MVLTLVNRVNTIKKIVLPLVSRDDLIIEFALNRISNHRDSVNFLQVISDHIGDDSAIENRKLLESEIVFVGTEKNNQVQNMHLWKDGEEFKLETYPSWVFIPYNVESQKRREMLIAEFDQLLNDNNLQRKLGEYDIRVPAIGKDLYEQLKNSDFVANVIKVKELKNAIRLAYKNVTSGVNANSLLLYSGPRSVLSGYRLVTHRTWDYDDIERPGCLYTGDSNFEPNIWKIQKYSTVWDIIGTIQLPHHGSLASFDFEKNPIDKEYVFPVSCGSTNSYGHPSSKVLAYLMTKNCSPMIVTELVHTMYMQRIVREMRE